MSDTKNSEFKNYEFKKRECKKDDIVKNTNRGKDLNKTKRGNIRAMDGQYYSKSREKSKVIKTTVKNLNLECVRPQRAGVIIYTLYDGSIKFGMGLDSESHDLTDFAGSIRYRHDRNVISGALREFDEETLGIFESITKEDIDQCLVIYDEYNLIIFIHMDIDPNAVCSTFNDKYEKIMNDEKRVSDPEVCGITWLEWEDFQNSIKQKDKNLWTRLQKFLFRAEDFSNLL